MYIQQFFSSHNCVKYCLSTLSIALPLLLELCLANIIDGTITIDIFNVWFILCTSLNILKAKLVHIAYGKLLDWILDYLVNILAFLFLFHHKDKSLYIIWSPTLCVSTITYDFCLFKGFI